MTPEMVAGLFALLGVLLGGLISWWLQKDRSAANFATALEAIKTEHMAEKTALHYLNHQGYRDRSFELLAKRLGGFEGNELRKILVRAGAVRYTRQDGTEWWRLLSRNEKSNNRAEQAAFGVENADLR
mgnify:CR=1 FL=1